MTLSAPAPSGSRPRVLVVEDDADVGLLLRRHLGRLGWDVHVAGTGEDGLEHALANPPDLVVLDIVLPGVDGRTVLQRLREHASTRSCPVVATTMLDSAELADAGFDGVLPKPFTRGDIARVVAAFPAAQEGQS